MKCRWPVLVCLFGTIDAHALADVRAQRTPAAVDPDVIGVVQKYRFESMGAPSDFDCQQFPPPATPVGHVTDNKCADQT